LKPNPLVELGPQPAPGDARQRSFQKAPDLLGRRQGLGAGVVVGTQLAQRQVKFGGQDQNKESLLNAITEKIKTIDDQKQKTEQQTASPALSKKEKDLIKNLFAFSENKDMDAAALEGAVVLAKFGQFDRALADLKSLLSKENVRLEAAKNILRCHLAVGPPDAAVNQYHEWFGGDIFPSIQMEIIRSYLEDILQKRGIEAALPSPLSATSGKTSVSTSSSPEAEPEEEFLDITSIGITFESGPSKGKMLEFDVNFQSGNMLSLIISKNEQEIIEDLKPGTKIKNVQFYSPIAIFNGIGVVSSKTQIKSGPKQGDFCLDIRIAST